MIAGRPTYGGECVVTIKQITSPCIMDKVHAAGGPQQYSTQQKGVLGKTKISRGLITMQTKGSSYRHLPIRKKTEPINHALSQQQVKSIE